MRIGGAAFHQSMHMDDDQLSSPVMECPFCSSLQRKEISILQKNPRVLLLKCLKCHAYSASRIPTQKALKDYYSNYYDSPDASNSGYRVTVDDLNRFGSYLAGKLNQYLDKKYIKILDFGGGDGSISSWTAKYLLKMGMVKRVKIVVADYHEKVISTRDERISVDKADRLENIQSAYDIVIASAIIEHLPRPGHVIDQLLNLLDMGGILYARTPYVVPLIKLFGLFGIKWDFTYPAHLHDLGQKFWESYFSSRKYPDYFIEITESKPSIIETTLKKHFIKTLAAYIFKAPWYLLNQRYKLVGGWEVFLRKAPIFSKTEDYHN